MEIITVSIDTIKPYEKNAKEHPKEQIEQIKKSILDYGNNDPIAVDENNVIIEGHGRYIAMCELGYNEVEIIRLEHMTEEQKKAYRLIHNKLTMNSDFDFDILEKELAELDAFDVDMSLFGFDESVFEDGFSTDFELPDDDKPQTRTITLSLCEEQFAIASACIDFVIENNMIVHDFGNNNKRSNALFEAVYEWAEQKKLS